MYYLLCVFIVIYSGFTQDAGESCIEKSARFTGVCTPPRQCESARDDFLKYSIWPTYCLNENPKKTLICCAVAQNVSQIQTTTPQITTSSNTTPADRPRISERKCEEYNRVVGNSSVNKCDDEESKLSYMVFIEYWYPASDGNSSHFICRGSLISPRFVVTTVECAAFSSPAERKYLRVVFRNIPNLILEPDTDTIDSHGTGSTVKKIYKSDNKDFIALLELTNIVVSFNTKIRPACLWSKFNFDSGYDGYKAVGWAHPFAFSGTFDTKEYYDCLKMSKSTTDSQACVEKSKQTEPCEVNSKGGAHVIINTDKKNNCIINLLGVTQQLFCPGADYSHMVRISKYIDWIESIVWPGE